MIPAYWSPTKKLMVLGAMAGGKLVEDTATGNPLTFITDKAKPLKSLLIPFTPKQSGTGDPSPENIRSILPWDGLSVFGGGKNLFNVNSAFQNPSDTSYENNTKRIFTPITYCLGLSATNFFDTSKVVGYSIQNNVLTLTENGGYGMGFALPLKAGKKYSIQCDGTNFRANGAFYAKDGSLISTQNSILYEGTRPSYQFVVPENTEMTVVVFVCKTSGQEATFRNIQIEYADTASAYEEYRPITETDIVFPSPVYGGEHEAVSGKLIDGWAKVEIKNCYYIGTWDGSKGAYWYITLGEDVVAPKKKAGSGLGMCESLLPVSNVSTAETRDVIAIFDNNIVRWVDTEHMTLTRQEYREYLANNPIVICYQIATPTEQTLTGQQITALVGNNTIWSDADGNMTAVYLKKK